MSNFRPIVWQDHASKPSILIGSPNTHATQVTEPFLPPLEEFLPYLETIWANKWLTNAGPFHEQLESELAGFLGVPQISLVSNGTTALWLALQALRIQGEVITTPFSFVATTHALRLAGATPVFVDIDPSTCNLAPARIEEAITSHTTAIMPVHCFGHPCDVEAINAIAERHNLQVIYDAAHAFGVKYKQNSILNHGDLSTLSFHATKVFNTFEGGAIVSKDLRMKRTIDRLRNFGFDGDSMSASASINGKMNEVQAAFGLLQLRHVENSIAHRGWISAQYREGLSRVEGVTPFSPLPDTCTNNAYFPVLVDDRYPLGRDGLFRRLINENIFARRYFHPLICDMPGYRHLPSAQTPLPNARAIGERILCLPLHAGISKETADRIVRIVANV